MKWKEALYILNDKELLTKEELDSIATLPKQRDKIFGDYIACFQFEPEIDFYYETKMPDSLVSTFQMCLVSLRRNRRLDLAFSFWQGRDIFCGAINDSISKPISVAALGDLIEMDLLVENRKGTKPQVDYRRLSSYSGTLEQRFSLCLEQIKMNYDTHALDIVKGETWDDKARDTSFM